MQVELPTKYVRRSERIPVHFRREDRLLELILPRPNCVP